MGPNPIGRVIPIRSFASLRMTSSHHETTSSGDLLQSAAPLQSPFSLPATPDGEAFENCLRRKGTPERVHNVELYLDFEVQQEIARRYGIWEGLDPEDRFYWPKCQIAIQRFLGYDYVTWGLWQDWKIPGLEAEDTAGLKRESGRRFTDHHKGPVMSWQDFERFDWPDAEKADTSSLEWLEKNLPEDMCLIGGVTGHFLEYLTALMGYENLCYALADNRELVRAISNRVNEYFLRLYRTAVQFSRVRMVWGSDDLGFRTGTLISPQDLREFVLPAHKAAAKIFHDAGKLYLLHCCGQIDAILEDLIEDVRIDAKHSYEDTILPVTEAKRSFGGRIAVLGGIDMDFLCRSTQEQVRERVRETLKVCQPGGGYCLGTGNTVANFLPVDNYLAMLDEGRRFAS